MSDSFVGGLVFVAFGIVVLLLAIPFWRWTSSLYRRWLKVPENSVYLVRIAYFGVAAFAFIIGIWGLLGAPIS